MVNVQEKQIEEKFEKIYKEESETKSRRGRQNPQIWFYTWQTCVRSVFNVADVYKTCNNVADVYKTCNNVADVYKTWNNV